MAEKGWTAQIATAAGVAAGTGAAQLGLGYGLGVVVWPVIAAGDDSIWLGSLGWATWISASATVFGAVIAGRLGRAAGGLWRLALAISAAVGALLTVALIALPARAAVRTNTFAPETIAGGYAVIGVLLGLVIAYWAVASKPVAANLIATAAWLWSLAVAAVVASVFWHRPSATYLSSWQFAAPDSIGGRYGTIFWPSAGLTLLAALIIGVIGVLPAVRRADLGVGAASSGAVGPVLVAAAFFVLAPQLKGALGPLESAYLIAPYAVLAGLAGSALTVALGQRRAARRAARTTPAAVPAPRQAPSGPAAGRPVPNPSAQSTSAGRAAPPAEASGTPSAPAPAAAASPSGEPSAPRTGRQRPSFLGRLRRSSAAQEEGDRPGIATGRAKAPGPAAGTASTAPSPSASAGRKASSAAPAGPAAPAQPVTGSDAPRGKAPVARPAGSARPGVASVDGAARPLPASAPKPGKSDSRSTVAPPPAAPAVVKINPPRSGESSATELKPAPAIEKAAAKSTPGQADAASSDKTPPEPKTAAKPTKATPAKAVPATKSAPGKPTPPATQNPAGRAPGGSAAGGGPSGTRPAGSSSAASGAEAAPGGGTASTGPAKADDAGSGGKSLADASPLWVDDTAELPAQEPKKRGIRRFGR